MQVTHQYIDSKGNASLYLLLSLGTDPRAAGLERDIEVQGRRYRTRVVQSWRLLYEGPKPGKRKQILRQ